MTACGLIAVIVLGALVAAPRAEASAAPVTRTYASVTCTWPSSTSEGSVVCGRSDGTGFAGAVAQRFVLFRNAKWQVVFFRNQPTRSPGYGPANDPRIFHSETHRGIVCYWSRQGGGAAVCNRADRHGYVLLVGARLVGVANEASNMIFLRNQP